MYSAELYLSTNSGILHCLVGISFPEGKLDKLQL